MKVEDAHGNVRKYKPEKIVRSAKRAGFSEGQGERIEEEVTGRIWDDITTRKLHSIVFEEMEKLDRGYALRYRLRESIAELDPRYHEFEKYVTYLLEDEGFDTSWSPRPKPQGECIDHEIDVMAERGKSFVVECKHHYHHHRFTGLDVAMRQQARLEDLRKGNDLGVKNSVEADKAWVIVNTKLSDHAKEYAKCKGIRMTAWKYPEGEGLDSIIERNKAYPITMLRPPHHVKVELSKRNILIVNQLLELTPEQKRDLGLDEKVIEDIQEQARDLLKT
ncbi:MAG: restriction endonuclease [Candidatus Nanohaloarchaeota archaeon QJJ-9]|nr:restriction endonuclease [Candidatus Nanohaloarchaeota archaeon QJJ-9]